MNFDLLSANYKNLYKENLFEFANNLQNRKTEYYIESEYSLFYPSFGSFDIKNIDFLIYGLALKTWDKDGKFKISELTDQRVSKLITQSIEYSNLLEKGDNNPLEWVHTQWNEHGFSTSSFWMITWNLINILDGAYGLL